MIDKEKIVNWWNDNYKNISDDEGWAVCSILIDEWTAVTKRVFIVCPYYKTSTKMNTNKIKARYNARERSKMWGWVINENDNIIDFDIDKFSIRQHLITGYELGLL
jgi:hypothetical protein